MKILVLLAGKYFGNKIGGSISHTIGVVDTLKELGHDVFFCSSARIPYYDYPIEYRLLKVRELNIPRINRVYRDFLIYIQLRNIIKDIKPDIIYARWRQNIFWCWLFKKKRNYRVVFECNTPPTMSLQYDNRRIGKPIKYLTKTLDKKICVCTDLISAVSDAVKDYLVVGIGCKKDKIIVNPNGVDAWRFSPEGDNFRDKYKIAIGDIVIGYAGLFRPEHGIEVLIKAFKALDRKKYHGLKLIIIGSGKADYENKLKIIAEEDNNIIFTGKVPFNIMPQYLRTCDIMVSPQISLNGKVFHQSPIKLYEYMAAERAIVASNVGQIRDVIKDGFNGLLFESGNVESLRDSLEQLLLNGRLRKILAQNARKEAVELYSWKNNVNRILERLDILKKKAKGALID
jgi:glycosyltransferase involved in cell wall biosynthesis